MLDGDAWGETPMKIKVVPHAVNVLVPRRFAKQLRSSGTKEAERIETERTGRIETERVEYARLETERIDATTEVDPVKTDSEDKTDQAESTGI